MSLIPDESDEQRLPNVLARSRAQLERRASLGDGLQLAVWSNHEDELSYRHPGHHTLSVYLSSGGALLMGQPHLRGGAGRFCVLPSEHESRWQVRNPIQFLHLYISDLAWAERVVRMLDAEPRSHTLTPTIYSEDAGFRTWAMRVAQLDWQSSHDLLTGDWLSQQVLDGLVLQSATPRERQALARPMGGLSSTARRRVLEHIDAHLAEPGLLSLSEMARAANLSEFHFARMFRQSMGCSAHDWVLQRRMARARQLLGSDRHAMPLSHVAADCGFASASHLSRSFRTLLGVTPTQFAGWRRNT